MLTKVELLKGTKKTKTIKIAGGEIEIRPLNEEQWAEIEAKRASIFQVDMTPVYKKVNGKEVYDPVKTKETMKMKTDYSKSRLVEFDMDVLTCKHGMVMDITEEEIRQISPPGTVKKIAEEIIKFSKVDKEGLEELKSFRTD